MQKVLLITLILSLQPILSFAESKYPFYLQVISQDEVIRTKISELINTEISNYGMQIKSNKNFKDGVGVGLYIYAQKHVNSGINKNTIIFSIAHTSNKRFSELMIEVFKDGSTSTEMTKKITADLILKKKGILKYLNVAAVDEISQINKLIPTILKNLSERIEGYYIN